MIKNKLPILMACLCLVLNSSASTHNVGSLPEGAFTIPDEDLYKVAGKDASIPKQYWGSPILSLNPKFVYFDRANIAVVTRVSPDKECGIYFYRTLSSYLPIDGPGRTFTWNSNQKHLEYVFTKKAEQGAPANP